MSVSVSPAPSPILQFFNNSGQPNAGGKILTQVGGVNYPTYQDSAGATPLPNPIPLNSRGEISNSSGQSCQLFLAAGVIYTFTQYDASNNQINQAQYVGGVASGGTGGAASIGTADGSSLQALLTNSLGHVIASIAALRLINSSDYTKCFLTGYATSGDGGGGQYYLDPSDSTSADNGGTIIVATDGGRWKLAYTGLVSVKQFGAKGDGTTDDTAAFNAALAAVVAVRAPASTYNLAGTVNVVQNGQQLMGDGQGATVFSHNNTTLPGIKIANGLTGWALSGFTSTRPGTAAAGADGITVNGSCSQAMVSDVTIEKSYGGFVAGGTDISRLVRVTCQQNQEVGFYFSPTGTNGTLQWYLLNCLSQKNGNSGYQFTATTGPAQCTLGTIQECYSFANSGFGIGFSGLSGVPIQGVRIFGGFYGQDANHEIYLDTYGGQHCIRGVNVELAGTIATGPSMSTAATNAGSGVEITANNIDVVVNGVHSDGNSDSGLVTAATTTQITGGAYTNNGAANTVGNQNGIMAVSSSGARIIVTGIRAGNRGTNTSQQNGVYGDDGNNTAIQGCDLTGNSANGFGAATNVTLISAVGNLPNTLSVLVPAGAGMVVGNATGGAVGGGTINTAGGLLKNNVAYTNP